MGWPGVENNQMLQKLKLHEKQRLSSVKLKLGKGPHVRQQQNKELFFAKHNRSYFLEVKGRMTSALVPFTGVCPFS